MLSINCATDRKTCLNQFIWKCVQFSALHIDFCVCVVWSVIAHACVCMDFTILINQDNYDSLLDMDYESSISIYLFLSLDSAPLSI